MYFMPTPLWLLVGILGRMHAGLMSAFPVCACGGTEALFSVCGPVEQQAAGLQGVREEQEEEQPAGQGR